MRSVVLFRRHYESSIEWAKSEVHTLRKNASINLFYNVDSNSFRASSEDNREAKEVAIAQYVKGVDFVDPTSADLERINGEIEALC